MNQVSIFVDNRCSSASSPTRADAAESGWLPDATRSTYGASRAQSSRFGASAWGAIGSRMDTVVSEATGQLRRQRLPSAA